MAQQSQGVTHRYDFPGRRSILVAVVFFDVFPVPDDQFGDGQVEVGDINGEASFVRFPIENDSLIFGFAGLGAVCAE
jgi:hypothetical protein